ncbi:hypothetical protein ACCO45_010011 [Purpureocillium lilacinum]|uniref:Uncharacterized protein n=1 Tax=Purpureocillium lilacinum TaxID=33203 RepID=A0ACC4DEB5_PURLI
MANPTGSRTTSRQSPRYNKPVGRVFNEGGRQQAHVLPQHIAMLPRSSRRRGGGIGCGAQRMTRAARDARRTRSCGACRQCKQKCAGVPHAGDA